MPVVSNTSPLLNLAIIGQLPLLREQFGEVVIPRAVLDELRPEEDLPGSEAIRAALEDGWIRPATVENLSLVLALQQDLDRGEAEAIALVVQTGIGKVLLDERDGRLVAKLMGLQTTGVLGVLLRGRLMGKVRSLKSEMVALRERAGFYIAQDLFESLLKEARELY